MRDETPDGCEQSLSNTAQFIVAQFDRLIEELKERERQQIDDVMAYREGSSLLGAEDAIDDPDLQLTRSAIEHLTQLRTDVIQDDKKLKKGLK